MAQAVARVCMVKQGKHGAAMEPLSQLSPAVEHTRCDSAGVCVGGAIVTFFLLVEIRLWYTSWP